ncbi:MAG TPA: DUF1203 domain-containing protein [Longimicrobium sp.]|nr:DUF1203 domain-containing protein [Longimicrobium sp.]
MTAYRTVALPTPVADAVRTSGRSPGYGHPAHAEVATGHGPCRHCLRAFRIGEERRILFTYDPFHGVETLPLPGPVFVHEAECGRYAEDGGFPADLLAHALTFNAYGRGRRLAAQEYFTGGDVDDLVGDLLARPGVDYLHVRDTAAGCYDLAILPG